jgi:hypothetical protein
MTSGDRGSRGWCGGVARTTPRSTDSRRLVSPVRSATLQCPRAIRPADAACALIAWFVVYVVYRLLAEER